jgi:hypothetical protein
MGFFKRLRNDYDQAWLHAQQRRDAQQSLNTALALLVGKRVTMFTVDWRVGLSWTDPGAGQRIIIETPFTIGPPGDEKIVVPGEYGPSIARVITLLGETVTSASTDPEILDLRLAFSNGSQLIVVRNHPADTGPQEAEWEYWDGTGQGGVWF